MICFVIIYLNILLNLPEPKKIKKNRTNKYEYKSVLTGTKFEIIINGNIAFAPSKWSFAQNTFLCVLNNFLVTSSGP